MDKATLVIAEAGVNHNGDMRLAFEMIRVAMEAGADVIKFQSFKADALASSFSPKAAYQKQSAGGDETQYAMLRRLELSSAMHHELLHHCKLAGIEFMSAPFDADSAVFLAGMGLRTLKIPSGEITNLPYLRRIGSLGCEIILSTGMSTLSEISSALAILADSGTPASKVTVLHCTTEYPAPFSEVNLRAMATIRDAFPLIKGVGLSDHTEGTSVPIAAVALGASVVEKHFTLDRTLPGPDHKASLEPAELRAMIAAIREVEAALGSVKKEPCASELKNMTVVRKSIVAARDLKKGDILGEDDLSVKRPATGISPMLWDKVLGMAAISDVAKDCPLPKQWME